MGSQQPEAAYRGLPTKGLPPQATKRGTPALGTRQPWGALGRQWEGSPSGGPALTWLAGGAVGDTGSPDGLTEAVEQARGRGGV